MTRAIFVSSIAALALSGCTSIPENGGFESVADRASTGLGIPAAWPGQTLSEQAAATRINAILAEPLTEDGVVELALLNNRSLRASYFSLKAAAGDYRDQSSLPNPFVSAMVFEVEDAPVTNFTYGMSIEILDILFLPRRLKAAGLKFEAAQAETAAAIIDHGANVRIAYYNTVAADQIAKLLFQADEAAQASVQVAEALFDAGNMPEVEVNREKLRSAEISLSAMQAQADLQAQREELNALLGLDGDAAAMWTISARLRNAPDTETLTSEVATAAASASLVLDASDAALAAAGARLGLENIASLIGELEFEAERERDDGVWENGIGAGIELPLFNWGSGARAAAGARLDAMVQQRIADEITLRAQARRLASDLIAARDIAIHHRTELLPLARDVLQGAQRDYNAMQIGVFALLDAKRDELDAGQRYVSALRDYWSLKARYDQMMAGGSIVDTDMGPYILSNTDSARGDH